MNRDVYFKASKAWLTFGLNMQTLQRHPGVQIIIQSIHESIYLKYNVHAFIVYIGHDKSGAVPGAVTCPV